MKKLLIAATMYLAVLGIAIAGTSNPPFAGEYGIRGGFNDWSLTEMDWDAATETYSVALALDAGNYNFKMSDNDWTVDVTFGNPGGSIGTFSPDATVDIDLADGFGTDLNIDILSAGTYLFELDLSGWSNTGALDAVLRVSQVPVPAAGLLLLSAIAGLRFVRKKS
ncbi:MAG: hypothetical protein AAFN78_07305 [Pseudomonadota bacterium]